jgi:hypothetical protein
MKKIAHCLAAQVAFAIPALAIPAFAQEAPPAVSDGTPDAPEIDWSRLNFDALSLMRDAPASGNALRLPGSSDAANWNRTENKNGSANVALKQSWSSGIATNVGVDRVGSQQGWAQPDTSQAPAGGAAWASAAFPHLGLIDQATLDARLDPDGDQRKFGARFEKSVPLNQQFSVTLQNGYAVSQPLGPQTLTGAPSSQGPSQVLDIEQLAKLNVLNSGTSLFAGSRQSSADERRLNVFGAEQNLLGGISVSGAVNENTTGGHDRSLTARFRRSW